MYISYTDKHHIHILTLGAHFREQFGTFACVICMYINSYTYKHTLALGAHFLERLSRCAYVLCIYSYTHKHTLTHENTHFHEHTHSLLAPIS